MLESPSPEPLDENGLTDLHLQTEKMAGLGELLTGVAHEINNPVNFIYGNLNYADRYLQDLLQLVALYRQAFPAGTPEIQAKIEAIDLDFIVEDFPKIQASMQLGATRIYEIVQSLRTFSHTDEQKYQQFNLHEGIDSTLTILSHRLKGYADRPEIKVEKKYGDLPAIECYAGQINQVVMNLLSNAIDAIETRMAEAADSPQAIDWEPKITIATQVENKTVQVTLQDNGCGMASAVQAQIFEPFFTTKGVKKGSGLGLAICDRIIRRDHNGQLDCQTRPNEGATFTFQLPIVQTLAPAQA